jgi:hypothetical protein
VSATPAAELARVKVRFPAWSIQAVEPGKGTGYTAHRGGWHIYAPSLARLETQLGGKQSRRRGSLR